MNAATIPTRIVSQMGMFCLPGRTSRASAPMIKPNTIAVMIPGDGHDDSRLCVGPRPSSPVPTE